MELEQVRFVAIVVALFLIPAAIVGILLYLDMKSIKRRAAGMPRPEKSRSRGFEVRTITDASTVPENEDLT